VIKVYRHLDVYEMVNLAVNTWGTKRFLTVVLTFQGILLALMGLSALGLDVPVLRSFVGFVCVALLPGLLMLRILKIHRQSIVETLLYSVGLSISLVMLIGFFVNIVYPYFGVAKPISLPPLMSTFTSVILILCAVVFMREKKEVKFPVPTSSIRWSDILSPPCFLLLLLPILSVLGTRLVYLHLGNTLLLLLLSIICLVVILVTFNKFIPVKLYPLAVGTISLSLLWHVSLIGPSLSGFDIHYHYYLQKLILSRSFWDISLGTMSNSMLSVVTLAPFSSLVLDLDGTWVYKIIYPVFLSLVPLALFQAFRYQIDDRIAFIGAFFFMSFPSFFFTTPTTSTQMIAEVFLALSILSFLDKGISATQRAALLIIFGLSIAVSHYGLSYIYLLYLLLILPILLLWRSPTADELWHAIIEKLARFRYLIGITRLSFKPVSISGQVSSISATYVGLFFVFCLAWYMYSSSGAAFYSIVRISDHIYTSLSTELLSAQSIDPQIRQALGQAPMRVQDVEWEVARMFQYITQLFIVVGVAQLIANFRKTNFHPVYIAMVLASTVIILLCIILPYFASAINMNRLYHITLFFLSPFGVLGGIAVFRWLLRALSLFRLPGIKTQTSLNLAVLLVLVPYFLFMSGFIFELTRAAPTSMPLSLYKSDWSIFTHPEISAGKWLGEVEAGPTTYSDAYADTQLFQYDVGAHIRLPLKMEKVPPDTYLFFRRWNIEHGEILHFKGPGPRYDDLESQSYQDMLAGRDRIYDSSGAQIYGPQ